MSGKTTKFLRLESEIEKCRTEGLWTRAIEHSKQLTYKNGQDFYEQFQLGESQLEEYLLENPPLEKNNSLAKAKLQDCEDLLCRVAHGKNKLSLEAELLIAKIKYCHGHYNESLAIYERISLESLVKDISSTRQLQIFAEAFSLKAMCLEKIGPPSSSKFRIAEQEERILNCFEKAGDLALVYFQAKEKSLTNVGGLSPSPTPQNVQSEDLGMILETAIQQSPLLYIKKGNLSEGVRRFRDLLCAVETRFTQCIRQTLARQLAEVLLRGMCEHSYIPLDQVKGVQHTNRPLQEPKKYSHERAFIPKDENEEALLLLLIAEAISTREAVLNRTEELEDARHHSFMNSVAVYDLLAIALVKRTQFDKLTNTFEKALRFSFDEFHVWHQFANSLICAGKYSRALLALKECSRLKPKHCVVHLQAAKLCYEYLHQCDEGVKLSEEASMSISEDHPLACRVYVSIGIGYSLKAVEMKLQIERQNLHRKALEAFKKAHTLDRSDFLALFHLGLQLAILRQNQDAMKTIKLALHYNSDHLYSLHLLVLLLTAQKQYEEAHSLLKLALREYPENLSLMLTLSKLEEVLFGPEEALSTCKHMLQLWKEVYEDDAEEVSSDKNNHKPMATDRGTFDRRSLAISQLNEFNDRDTGSVRAESIAASRVEQTLSEVASSLNSSFQPRPGSQQTWLLQAQIWLYLADLYIKLDKICEAEACLQETSQIFPHAHQVAYMRGRIFEHKQKYFEAKSCYENAVAINPFHTKSLQHLGMVLHALNNDKMAEKVLRDTVNIDPTSHHSWYMLGLVLQSMGQNDAASDCFCTALELENSSPIVPFTVIPRLMH